MLVFLVTSTRTCGLGSGMTGAQTKKGKNNAVQYFWHLIVITSLTSVGKV